jgi:hypothetical protein
VGVKKRRKGSHGLTRRVSPLRSTRSCTSVGSGSGDSASARHMASPIDPSISAGTSWPGDSLWAMNSPGGRLRAWSESFAGLEASSDGSSIRPECFWHPDQTGDEDDEVGNEDEPFVTHKVIVGQCASCK